MKKICSQIKFTRHHIQENIPQCMYQRPDIFSDNFYIKKNEWYNNQLKAFSQSRVYNMNFPSKLMNFHFYEAFKKCFSHSFNDKTFFALRKSKTFLWQYWLLKIESEKRVEPRSIFESIRSIFATV